MMRDTLSPGTVTAIGGAVVRDLMPQRVPAVFTQGTLYATVAIFVAAIRVVFVRTPGLSTGTGTLLAITVGAALRLVAYRRNWQLPRGSTGRSGSARGKPGRPRMTASDTGRQGASGAGGRTRSGSPGSCRPRQAAAGRT